MLELAKVHLSWSDEAVFECATMIDEWTTSQCQDGLQMMARKHVFGEHILQISTSWMPHLHLEEIVGC